MGHVQDRWWKDETDPTTGKPVKIKTPLHGQGLRYRVRYLDPEGREKSKSFPDRQKRAADAFLVQMEGDKRTGSWVDPNAGKMTFGVYAEKWLASQTFDVPSRNSLRWRLDAQILPYFERRALGSIRPTDVRAWVRWMQDRGIAASYQAGCFGHVSAIFAAAVDDKIIHENPCKARSVSRPKVPPKKVVPWSRDRVAGMRRELMRRYQVIIPLGAGCGLRQGEFFGLSLDDIDREAGVLHVVRQVRLVDSRRPVFAPPKRGKTREVPLAPAVLAALDAHAAEFPPVPVTLPWRQAGCEPTTVDLLSTSMAGGPHIRRHFNEQVWNPARKRAGVTRPTREDGTHALRHHFASVLLDAGESVKAVSEYLGHWDAGFTLATYTHLMPSSATRTRKAIDGWWSEVGEPGE